MAKPVDEEQRSQMMRKGKSDLSLCRDKNEKPIHGCNYSKIIIAYHKAVIINSYG